MLIRFCFSFAFVGLCTVSGRAEAADEFQRYMDATVAVHQFNGSVIVSKNDKIVFSAGYGMANFEHSIPNSPITKFRIGSITKQFTAMAVLVLQEQDKLSTSDPISKHLEDVPDTWQPITIHHLLTHTSGIPSFTGMSDYGPKMMLPQTVEQMVERFRDKPLDFPPGSKYRYSNSGYYLLGAIIESASGESFASYLRSAVLDPLELNDTGYETFAAVLPHRATGYERFGDSIRHAPFLDMSQPYSAGALYSTVDDLVRWDNALRAKKLLSERGYEAYYRPEKDDYAYGWKVTTENGRKTISHGGGINGFGSYILRVPEESLCVVVISNVMPFQVGRTAKTIAKIALGDDYETPKSTKVVQVDAGVLDKLAGNYVLAPELEVTIESGDDHLRLIIKDQPPVKLLPASETEFFNEVSGSRLSFGIKNGVAGFDLKIWGQTLRGTPAEPKTIESRETSEEPVPAE